MINEFTTRQPFGLPAIHYAACEFAAEQYQPEYFAQYGVPTPGWLSHARQRRAADYLAGRYCARAALKQLGRAPASLGILANRSPDWPYGITGSITHSGRRAAAMVACLQDYAGIGLDFQDIFDGSRVAKRILLPGELERTGASFADKSLMLTLLFSAKESLFKASCRWQPAAMNFLDYELTEFSSRSMRFSISDRDKAVKQSMEVYYAVTGNRVITACLIQHCASLPLQQAAIH